MTMATQIVFASNACSPKADTAFGPAVSGCRRDFDLTFTFELYFFVIVPSIALIIATIPRSIYLTSREPKVDGTLFRLTKSLVVAVIAVLQLVLVILLATTAFPVRQLSIVAFSLAFAASLGLFVLSPFEHTKTIRPSSIVNVYLFFSVLFDATIVRTFWLTPFNERARDVFTASFALKVVLLCLEATEKRKYFICMEDRERSSEESAGIYNEALYWWLNALISRGYWQDMKPTDLYPMSRYMTAKALDFRFWRSWDQSPRTKNKLLFVVVGALRWQFVAPIFPRLIQIAFTICQPLLVRRFLDYLLDPDQAVDQSIGHGMIGAYFLVYTGIAISGGFYRTLWFRTLSMIRTTLTVAIYRKTVSISPSASDSKAAVTLMSADIDRIVTGLREVQEIWANIIQIAIATYLLAKEIGYACIAPVVVAALSFATVTYLSNYTKIYQRRWLMQTQKRVGATSSILGSMKGIKLSGLTQGLQSIIGKLRLDEIRASKDSRLLGAYTSTVALFPTNLSPVLAFAVYTFTVLRGGATLDVSRLFTSLSTLVLLSQPLFSLFGGVVNSRQAIGCFDRIEQYLLSPSREDYREKALVIEDSDKKPDDTSEDENSALLRESENHELGGNGFAAPAIGSHSEILSLEKACFGWTKTDPPVVKDISWVVAPSTLNLLVGRSASGKSTLLKGILGETPRFEGSVRISDIRTSWCEQTPWLINGTIKKNITHFRTWDEELYQTVIHCCDLDTDIDAMPDRDNTNIGSKGFILSGGQKQRIAVARAVYSRPDLAIFDDIFSGLDTVTQNKVFTRLFGSEGLLHHWGTTVIIATHASNLLPSADHIVALGPDGRISEHGTFQSLKDNNGYVASLNVAEASTETQSSSDSLGDTQEETSSLDNKRLEASKPTKASSPKRTNPPVDLSIYAYYFRSIGFPYALIFFLLQLTGAFSSTFPVLWLKWWTESNSKTLHCPDRSPNEGWGMYIGVYAALQVAGLVTNGLLTWFCFSFMARESGLWLHERLLRVVMAAPMRFWGETDLGAVTTRFSQDIQLVDMNLPLQVLTATQNLFVCIAQAVLIASATGWIALSFPPLILAFYALQRYYSRTSRQLRLLELAEKAPVYTQFLETLPGLATIRAFGWERDLQEENFKLVDKAQKPWYLLFMVQRWLMLVLDLVTMCLAVVAVGVAVALRQSISAGGIGVALTQIIFFTGYIKQLITTQTTLETTIGAIARIKNFSEETENENIPAASQLPPLDWPSHGAVEIKGISATYTPTTSTLALQNISLSLTPGTTLGVCGRTGSGKSSLVLALYRMLDLTSGSILVDGIDISTLPRDTVRSRLNGLGQESFFLEGESVKRNLDPYGKATSPSMVAALQVVKLWDLFQEKGGLDKEFSAEMLSQGQRQMFCLARAILRKGSVVVLDEVTSSVDKRTDELMQEIIQREFKGRTVITIAHRLSNILSCDRVAVFESGKCVECDEPAVLLGREGSKLREMWEMSGKQG